MRAELWVTGRQLSQAAAVTPGVILYVYPQRSALRERSMLPLSYGSKCGSSVVAVITDFLSNYNNHRSKQFQVISSKAASLSPFLRYSKSGCMRTPQTHQSSPCALLSSPPAPHGSWNGLKYICTSCDDQNLLISNSSTVKPRLHHCMRTRSPHATLLFSTDSINGHEGLHIRNSAFFDAVLSQRYFSSSCNHNTVFCSSWWGWNILVGNPKA